MNVKGPKRLAPAPGQGGRPGEGVQFGQGHGGSQWDPSRSVSLSETPFLYLYPTMRLGHLFGPLMYPQHSATIVWPRVDAQ